MLWIVVVGLGLLVGCGGAKTDLALAPAAAEWTLGASRVEPGGDPSWTATYQGKPAITVKITRMSSNTLAFSAVQSWRAETGKLAFFHGRYFGIAEAAGADQRTLNRFVTAFAKTLPE